MKPHLFFATYLGDQLIFHNRLASLGRRPFSPPFLSSCLFFFFFFPTVSSFIVSPLPTLTSIHHTGFRPRLLHHPRRRRRPFKRIRSLPHNLPTTRLNLILILIPISISIRIPGSIPGSSSATSSLQRRQRPHRPLHRPPPLPPRPSPRRHRPRVLSDRPRSRAPQVCHRRPRAVRPGV